jgi:hypothetical protein
MAGPTVERWLQLWSRLGADDCIRISYATGLANIEKGLERMDRLVRGLKK